MGFSTLRILSSIVISTLLLPRFTLLYNSGQYQASSGQSSCTACPSGFYCATTGLTAYAACSAGTYSGSGAASCSACAAGKYSDTTASSSCNSCPGGKYQGSSAQTSCKPCPGVNVAPSCFFWFYFCMTSFLSVHFILSWYLGVLLPSGLLEYEGMPQWVSLISVVIASNGSLKHLFDRYN